MVWKGKEIEIINTAVFIWSVAVSEWLELFNWRNDMNESNDECTNMIIKYNDHHDTNASSYVSFSSLIIQDGDYFLNIPL